MANAPQAIQASVSNTAGNLNDFDEEKKKQYRLAIMFLTSKGYKPEDMPEKLLNDIYNFFIMDREQLSGSERDARFNKFTLAKNTAEEYFALRKGANPNKTYRQSIGFHAAQAAIAVSAANSATAMAEAAVATAAAASAIAQAKAGEIYSTYTEAEAEVLVELKALFKKNIYEDETPLSELFTVDILQDHIANIIRRPLQRMIYENILMPYDNVAAKRWYSLHFRYDDSMRRNHSRMVDALHKVANRSYLYEDMNKPLLEAAEEILRKALKQYQHTHQGSVTLSNFSGTYAPSGAEVYKTLANGDIQIGTPATMALQAEITKLEVEIQAKNAVIAMQNTKVAADRTEEEAREQRRELAAIAREKARERIMIFREKEREAKLKEREQSRMTAMTTQFSAHRQRTLVAPQPQPRTRAANSNVTRAGMRASS